MSTLALALASGSPHRFAADLARTARSAWRAVASRAVAKVEEATGAREVALVADDCVRVWHAGGRRIDCHAGTAWITLDGDPRDIVIAAGESFVVDRDVPALIFALHDTACLTIGERPAVRDVAPKRRQPRRRRIALLAVALGVSLGVLEAAAELADLTAAVHLAS